MITGDIANEPSANCWWYQKGPNGDKIAPGNRDFEDMMPLKAFLHMMPPEQLTLMLELTNERVMEKGKQEMTRQELLRWLGVCILIGSIKFGVRGPQEKMQFFQIAPGQKMTTSLPTNPPKAAFFRTSDWTSD